MSFDLIFIVLSLILVKFVKIVDVLGLFLQLFLIVTDCFSESVVHILEFGLKSINFLSQPVSFTIQHLSDRCFFLDKLLNFSILFIYSAFQLNHLILKTLNILLMVDPHLLNFTLMNFIEFYLKTILLAL